MKGGQCEVGPEHSGVGPDFVISSDICLGGVGSAVPLVLENDCGVFNWQQRNAVPDVAVNKDIIWLGSRVQGETQKGRDKQQNYQ